MADDLRPESGSAPQGDAVWQDDNERGLRFARDGEWEEAREAFATAADALARSLPGHAPAHEPLALVLGNLAQACFRGGHRDEAVQHQKRACALRVAITGEDGMPVARARMDLAVMLAAAGRLEEANALVQRAIAALDHRVGEEDARLAIVLENAARIAIASGAPANAEPLLLRLHALLDAHELSTSRADALLARVAAVRASQTPAALPSGVAHTPAEQAPADISPEPLASAFDAERPVYAHASIEMSEWDDQPLRDAVAVTDVLLRNTPAGVPAITSRRDVEPDIEIASEMATDIEIAPEMATDIADDIMATLTPAAPLGSDQDADAPSDVLDLDLALDDAFMQPNAAPDALAFGDLTLTDDAPTPNALTHVAEPVTPSPPSTAPSTELLLDFAVQHGALDEADGLPSIVAPPITVPVPHALTSAMPAPAQPPAPPLALVNSGLADQVAPLSDMVGTAPPAARATAEQRAVASERGPASPAAPRARRESAPASGSKVVPIVVGIVTAIGGVAAYLLMR